MVGKLSEVKIFSVGKNNLKIIIYCRRKAEKKNYEEGRINAGLVRLVGVSVSRLDTMIRSG